MTENYVQLPSDTSNTGKKVRTNQRTVGANDVEEHFNIIQDYSSDRQAQVVINNSTSITGLAVWAAQAGSYNIYVQNNLTVEQDRGVFGWSGASFNGSITGTPIFSPGAGSKVFLKGFTATSDISTKFRLFFSGGTSTLIGTYTLPASGTANMNFLGMEPSGATNQPIAVGLLNAGSLDISIATRQSL